MSRPGDPEGVHPAPPAAGPPMDAPSGTPPKVQPGASIEERLQYHRALDDHIAQSLRQAEASGELRAAPSFGRPMAEDAGYAQTPESLRMPFKILRNAGAVPPEVELMREIAAWQQAMDACVDEAERRSWQQRIAERRQLLAMRLEKLQRTGSL